MKRPQTLMMASMSASALVLIGCGGGGGAASGPSSATNTTVVSKGTITGFGSVFVNGVRFDTSSARFKVNGDDGTQADLAVGQVITVHGHRDSQGRSFADRIDCDDLVTGPVASVTTASNQLVVLGQTISVDAETSFDDSVPGAALSGIAAGNIVEVSGLRRADGTIQATRIEIKPAGTRFEVTGTASSVDPATHTLSIGALVVNYASATVQDFASGQPQNGDLVEANGTSVNASNELVASSIELQREDAASGAEVEVEGLITRFASATDFDVAGQKVTTNSGTRYENGAASDLALNVKVEVEGSADASGMLVATKVEFKRQSNSRVAGLVESVDQTNKKLVIMGIDVSVTGTTRVEDKSHADVNMFNLSNVVVGDYLEVRGAELPADSNDVVASRLEREDASSRVELRGTVDSVTEPGLSILGVNVQTTGSTQFKGQGGASVNASAFFAAAAGQEVSVKGTYSGGVLTATEVEIEGADD